MMSRVLLLCLCLCVCAITLTPPPPTEARSILALVGPHSHGGIHSRSHFISLHDANDQSQDHDEPVSSSTGGTAGGEEVLSSSDETNLKTGKAVLIPLIFFATLAASYLPWGLKRFHNAMNWMAVGACFTAGIILGAALSHLLQEAGSAFEEYETMKNPPVEGEEHSHTYPYAPLIAGAVLLLLVTIDFKMVRHGLVGDDGHDHDDGDGHGHGDGASHSHVIANLTQAQLNGQRKPEQKKPTKQQGEQQQNADGNGNGDAQTDIDVHRVEIDTSDVIPLSPNKSDIPFDTFQSSSTIVTNENDTLPESDTRGSKAQIARAWIFFCALSIHSIFDGLSVGAASSIDGFYSMLAAVAGHKLLDGFALGVPVYFANFHPLHTAISFIFCAGMTPLGIGIGMAATEGVGSESATLAEAIILSMSAGSFLFISLVELLPAGFASSTWINLKLAAVFFGWGIMTMLAKWV